MVFVASRRQTRLTALDLISYAAADDAAAYEGSGGIGGRRWVHMDQEALDNLAEGLTDEALRHCIVFGASAPRAFSQFGTTPLNATPNRLEFIMPA